jgi:hypothetical protein
MSSKSRDELLGFVLGALEPEQHELLAQELENDPELRDAIRKLEACAHRLGLNAKAEHFEPPVNLAERACQVVAAVRKPRPALRPRHEPGSPPRRYTWSDMVVAACALVVAVAVLIPSLLQSRVQADRLGCENNLRQLGRGYLQYSALQPDGSFPAPEASGNRAVAGVFAPILMENQIVQSPAIFLCPSAQRMRPTPDFRPPTLAELDAAQGEMLAAIQQVMGGDYGAHMGYTVDGQLQRPCNSRRAGFVILADAPSETQQGRRSANHGPRGLNVVCEDGHVRFLVDIDLRELADDPFFNREGRVAAGIGCDDSCVGRSHDRPLPVLPSQR